MLRLAKPPRRTPKNIENMPPTSSPTYSDDVVFMPQFGSALVLSPFADNHNRRSRNHGEDSDSSLLSWSTHGLNNTSSDESIDSKFPRSDASAEHVVIEKSEEDEDDPTLRVHETFVEDRATYDDGNGHTKAMFQSLKQLSVFLAFSLGVALASSIDFVIDRTKLIFFAVHEEFLSVNGLCLPTQAGYRVWACILVALFLFYSCKVMMRVVADIIVYGLRYSGAILYATGYAVGSGLGMLVKGVVDGYKA